MISELNAKYINGINFKNISEHSTICGFNFHLSNGFFEVDLLDMQDVFVKISVRRTCIQQKRKCALSINFNVNDHQTVFVKATQKGMFLFSLRFVKCS